MANDENRPEMPASKKEKEGDMGEGSFSETHVGQPPSPPNVKGPRHVPIPSKDKG